MAATDPKDKIYTLLGLADRWPYGAKFSVLRPETTTVRDVYRDLVHYSLARGKSLT